MFAPASWVTKSESSVFSNEMENRSSSSKSSTNSIVTHTQSPITTGTSVLGMIFDGGVMIASDMLGSYGSLAKFQSFPRVLKINENLILGCGGDLADFQHLQSVIEQKQIDEECMDDGFVLKPHSLYSWLTRVLYNRRSKFDPLWTTFLVGGLQDGEPFLGYVDKIGLAYQAPLIASGYGSMIALPLMRDALEKKPLMKQEEARALLLNCMRIMFYRDARSSNKIQIATVTAAGSSVEGPIVLETNWELANFIKGYE